MRKLSSIFLIILLVVTVFGCTANFKNNTYKAIGVAGITYDTSMKAAADLQKKGRISSTQWRELEKVATEYYIAYHSAIDAFEIYLKVETPEQKQKVIAILNEMQLKLPKVTAYIELLKGGVK